MLWRCDLGDCVRVVLAFKEQCYAKLTLGSEDVEYLRPHLGVSVLDERW
jgi:hypothetical protein